MTDALQIEAIPGKETFFRKPANHEREDEDPNG